MNSNFQILKSDEEEIIIVDLGPWDQYKTVTNDIENVVQYLFKEGVLTSGKRLIYYDSDKDPTEAFHEDGIFKGYGPA